MVIRLYAKKGESVAVENFRTWPFLQKVFAQYRRTVAVGTINHYLAW
jgi:hypothetical protein